MYVSMLSSDHPQSKLQKLHTKIYIITWSDSQFAEDDPKEGSKRTFLIFHFLKLWRPWRFGVLGLQPQKPIGKRTTGHHSFCDFCVPFFSVKYWHDHLFFLNFDIALCTIFFDTYLIVICETLKWSRTGSKRLSFL